jgi:hypothetical protein
MDNINGGNKKIRSGERNRAESGGMRLGCSANITSVQGDNGASRDVDKKREKSEAIMSKEEESEDEEPDSDDRDFIVDDDDDELYQGEAGEGLGEGMDLDDEEYSEDEEFADMEDENGDAEYYRTAMEVMAQGTVGDGSGKTFEDLHNERYGNDPNGPQMSKTYVSVIDRIIMRETIKHQKKLKEKKRLQKAKKTK